MSELDLLPPYLDPQAKRLSPDDISRMVNSLLDRMTKFNQEARERAYNRVMNGASDPETQHSGV